MPSMRRTACNRLGVLASGIRKARFRLDGRRCGAPRGTDLGRTPAPASGGPCRGVGGISGRSLIAWRRLRRLVCPDRTLRLLGGSSFGSAGRRIGRSAFLGRLGLSSGSLLCLHGSLLCGQLGRCADDQVRCLIPADRPGLADDLAARQDNERRTRDSAACRALKPGVPAQLVHSIDRSGPPGPLGRKPEPWPAGWRTELERLVLKRRVEHEQSRHANPEEGDQHQNERQARQPGRHPRYGPSHRPPACTSAPPPDPSGAHSALIRQLHVVRISRSVRRLASGPTSPGDWPLPPPHSAG